MNMHRPKRSLGDHVMPCDKCYQFQERYLEIGDRVPVIFADQGGQLCRCPTCGCLWDLPDHGKVVVVAVTDLPWLHRGFQYNERQYPAIIPGSVKYRRPEYVNRFWMEVGWTCVVFLLVLWFIWALGIVP